MNSEEREREQRLAAEAEPMILEGLRNGSEPREVSQMVAEELGVDEVKAYRWTMYIDEKRQKRRKRIAVVALSITWLGAIGAGVGVAALLLAWAVAGTLFWSIVIGAGLIIALPALAIALLARRIAYRK